MQIINSFIFSQLKKIYIGKTCRKEFEVSVAE
jgi:hypothetical protein